MARTTGSFFVMGGLLGMLITALMPATPGAGGNKSVLYVVSCVAAIVGVGVLGWGDRLPPRTHHLPIAFGTTLISIVVVYSPNVYGAMALSTMYVFVACDAAFFFTLTAAALHLLYAVVSCVVLLGTRDGLPWWAGVLTASVAVSVGAVVHVLGRLAAEADLDLLTGLLNRRGFDRLLNAELSTAAKTDRRPALVLLDLDRFQTVNDHLGRRGGDAVLQRVAATWTAMLEPDQQLARYGGDAFAILLPDTTESVALQLADRLRSAITASSSAGVTSWQSGESASLLVSRADVGLYRAKQTGRNRTVVESSHRPPLAVELRDAIDKGALEVQYQPIVSLGAGGRAVGVEALLRWTSVAQPGVSTESLIRVAEEYDLIGDLDQLVLRRACEDASRLQRADADIELTLNVNVSGLELADPEYAARVQDILAATGWPAHQLVLEVTESELAAESATAVTNLRELRYHGVRIAIDDFGTGYSSLSRLATLPSDILKVDGSFVAAISSGGTGSPLLGVIAALSDALDLQVIAEGVETEQQAAVLTELGFALAQGHHYSESQPVSALLDDLSGAKPGTWR
ncbi:putative bifunctional diguanylate cyclase/phosphodiesterase [Skermania piniformis]|uniref:Bifunctional diguanylate cyclase/phosphodiesterase n=1 Tax=Skermania pinensis TaxID=39122 RepID=A0ABX8S842_9ACTN|nr:bifunctional diguanylate cyclase/phosphodiesterase [Skermania piniformis]QXQ14018.1 bifunctional diguanylate cyclase/phosphodiesterase [Skermania piniformis]